ncbi:tetratricopeptide repeat protein [Nocardia sp. NPDC051570]|uniref:tetratricopeptide repeat protein n=1 Tax=Nocardia sp. NPDC051570 TaxID=3364324 RepID=UPI0037A1643D
MTTRCDQPECTGTIQDGYCDVCGLAPTPAAAGSSPTGRSRRGTVRTRSTRTARSTRGRLGAGLVEIAPVPYRDPATALLADPRVPEHDRFCSRCDRPVGRGRDGASGRDAGFCAHCGAAFSFTPKLRPGDMVADQYEILGCLAHGGLGWIYLARDRNVSDRWVVLKGLLDTGDADALAAALAEQQFLATVEHPTIVRIYNFVRHPDPISGEPAGYIVMEYVGGVSLKQLRARRNDEGVLEPLSPAAGLAYMLEILPALGHLHSLGLLYCDFKPDNVIQSEEQLKLIDLGAVRHIADEDSVGFKTDGYCAPELETEGASIESDLYTVGRTLAVLTFNFDFRTRYRHDLPPAADIPVLQRHPSLYRMLRRATAAEPSDRFGSAAEMAEQLTGVLREVVAAEQDVPKPALSTLFGAERTVFGAEMPHWPVAIDPSALVTALPISLVDPADPAAGQLGGLAGGDPRRVISACDALPATTEVTLARVRARIEIGDIDTATAELDALDEQIGRDWRGDWYRGLAALAAYDAATARASFDAVYDALPGESAPKLALAAAGECAGEIDAAATLYELVWRTDHGYLSAAFGLARTRSARGDTEGALAAVESVPESSAQYRQARLAAIRIRVRHGSGPHLVAAGRILTALDPDPETKARFAIQILEAALTIAGAEPDAGDARILGCPFDERPLRHALETHYRALARLADDHLSRRELVNRANAIRPLSWV